MPFDWNNGPFEYVKGEDVFAVTNVIVGTDTVSVYYKDLAGIERQICVWTSNGDCYGSDSTYHGKYYVRKALNPVEPSFEDMTDTQVAELLRTTDKLANKLTALLYKRGYTILDTDGDSIHDAWARYTDESKYQQIGRIYKTETIVKNHDI